MIPSHEQRSIPLGKAHIEERGNEAVAVGRFNLAIEAGRDWHSWLRADLATPPAVQEWSFAFDVLASDSLPGGGRRIRKLSEIEVSPVLRGAGIGTRTTCAGDTCKSAPAKSCCSEVAKIASEAERVLAASEAASRYRYKSLGSDLRLSDLAERVCRAWNIPTPRVELVRECEPGEKADAAFRVPITGLHSPGEVLILDGRGIPAELRTLGHELAHEWQRARGLALSEPEAEEFGERFAAWAVYAPAERVPRVA